MVAMLSPPRGRQWGLRACGCGDPAAPLCYPPDRCLTQAPLRPKTFYSKCLTSGPLKWQKTPIFRTNMSDPVKNPIKTPILILEEHPLLRYGIRDYLNCQPDMIVCGDADNIRDARSKIAECKPQLLVIALRLGVG